MREKIGSVEDNRNIRKRISDVEKYKRGCPGCPPVHCNATHASLDAGSSEGKGREMQGIGDSIQGHAGLSKLRSLDGAWTAAWTPTKPLWILSFLPICPSVQASAHIRVRDAWLERGVYAGKFGKSVDSLDAWTERCNHAQLFVYFVAKVWPRWCPGLELGQHGARYVTASRRAVAARGKGEKCRELATVSRGMLVCPSCGAWTGLGQQLGHPRSRTYRDVRAGNL